MAKGQARSNKEVKKPKQEKKPSAAAASPFSSVAAKSSVPTPIKKK
jgi:hypothetical protein